MRVHTSRDGVHTQHTKKGEEHMPIETKRGLLDRVMQKCKTCPQMLIFPVHRDESFCFKCHTWNKRGY